jgi:hypothetical protein
MTTKAQLLSEIESMYPYIGVPFETTSSDEHVPSEAKTYSVMVAETGNSEKSKKPVTNFKYVNFIVYNEGAPQEEAYYTDNEPINEVNKDLTGNNSLEAIHRIYVSEYMRGRVQAAVAKAAQDILNESIPETILTSNANSGQNIIYVQSPYIFWSGKEIIIKDNLNSEIAVVDTIGSNYITVTQNLTNSYTTANNAIVKYKDNKEREYWAATALLNPDTFTLSMTNLVALNPTVQSQGGLATDNDIQFIVNSFINKIARIIYKI